MPPGWDQAYAEGDTPWDKGRAAPPLREFLRHHRVPGGEVLVPGCGTGHDVRLLAAGGASVTGMDIAPRALLAAERFARAGGERYAEADFLKLPARFRGAFDWVVEHTLLCAVQPEERAAYARAVAAALKPGGAFLGVFFIEVPDDNGDGPPFATPRAELDVLFGDRFRLVTAFVPEATYPERPPGCEEVRWYELRQERDAGGGP